MARRSPEPAPRWRVLAVAAMAVALGAAGAGLAHSDDGPPPSGTTMVQGMPADLAAGFGVLRRAADPGDRLPELAAGMVDAGPRPRLGANPALARHALGRPDGLNVYVVPGRDWLCAVDNEGHGTCNHSADALAGRVLGTAALDPETARVWGLVPDGPDAVDILHADGSVARAPVRGNAYVADTAADLIGIRFTDAGGTHTVAAAAPLP